MRNTSPLGPLLPKPRQGILAATLVQPEKAWNVSELARRMEVPPSSLQREPQDLTDDGILKSYRQGRFVYYQAHQGSPLCSDPRGLLLEPTRLVGRLACARKPPASKLL